MGSASQPKFSLVLAGSLLALGVATTACGDGGWSSDPPDTILGHRPDAEHDGAIADTAVDIAPDPGGTDPGAPDTPADLPPDDGATDVTGDAVSACGQGPGNELGIGRPCTKGGGECPEGTKFACDVDLDAQGVGVCIKLPCKPDVADDCGSNAGCCKPTGSPLNVCIHDDCLPPECASLRGN